MFLVLIKILFYSCSSVCHCSQLYVYNNNCFVCSSVYNLCLNYYNYQAIFQKNFVTSIFNTRLLSLQAQILHTKLIKLLRKDTGQLEPNGFVCYFFYLHLMHKQKQLLENCQTDLCNVDLQTTIILFKDTASSHKT